MVAFSQVGKAYQVVKTFPDDRVEQNYHWCAKMFHEVSVGQSSTSLPLSKELSKLSTSNH